MAARAKPVSAASQVQVNRFLALVYLVMSIGMVITAVVAGGVASNKALVMKIAYNPWIAFGLFIIQILLVGVLSAAAMRMAPGAALIIFFLYSGLTGLSLSTIALYYTQASIASAFWMAAGMFLLMSIVGMFIRTDLSGLGRFLLMALLGYLFGLFFTLIFPSYALSQSLNFIGILLFAALTVWDTQRLKQISVDLQGRQGMGGMVVVGALMLYLDFINLFLLLLRTSRR
jgi:uncharacterized protein